MAEQRRLRLARRLGPEGKSKSVLKPIEAFDGNRGPRGRQGAALNCTLQPTRTSLAAPIGQKPRPYPPTSHPAMHHMPPGNGSHAKTAPAPSRRLRAMRPRPGAAGLPATRRAGRRITSPTYLNAAPLASKAPRTSCTLPLAGVERSRPSCCTRRRHRRQLPSGRAPSGMKPLTDVRSSWTS